MCAQELAPDIHVAEAGRIMMAQQIPLILEHREAICNGSEITAVHEMRKAIRRTFTSFKLFSPYFEPGIFRSHKSWLRNVMRHLGDSRDLAVLCMKLAVYNETADDPLLDLEEYMQIQQAMAHDNLTRYLTSEKQQEFLAAYVDFTNSPGMGVLAKSDPWSPVKVAHIAPILIYQRVAIVRAYGQNLDQATVTQLHKLRIQFKELRYELQFFAPILGENIDAVLCSLEQSQDHLGELNDTKVALELLADVKELEGSVTQYQAYQEEELQRLVNSYWAVWQEFDTFQWRLNLADALAVL